MHERTDLIHFSGAISWTGPLQQEMQVEIEGVQKHYAKQKRNKS